MYKQWYYSLMLVIVCLIIGMVSIARRPADRPFMVVRELRDTCSFNIDSMVIVKMADSQDMCVRQYVYHSSYRCQALNHGTAALISYYDHPDNMHLIPCAYCAKIFSPKQDPADHLRKLYDQVVSSIDDVDLGTYAEFKDAMQDASNRKWLYDLLMSRNAFDFPYDYETFEWKIGY